MTLLEELKKVGAVKRQVGDVVIVETATPTTSSNESRSIEKGSTPEVSVIQAIHEPEMAKIAISEQEMRQTIIAIVGPLLRASRARFDRITELVGAASRVQEALRVELDRLAAEFGEYELVYKELEASASEGAK
jgi:hypothetical protein